MLPSLQQSECEYSQNLFARFTETQCLCIWQPDTEQIKDANMCHTWSDNLQIFLRLNIDWWMSYASPCHISARRNIKASARPTMPIHAETCACCQKCNVHASVTLTGRLLSCSACRTLDSGVRHREGWPNKTRANPKPGTGQPTSRGNRKPLLYVCVSRLLL